MSEFGMKTWHHIRLLGSRVRKKSWIIYIGKKKKKNNKKKNKKKNKKTKKKQKKKLKKFIQKNKLIWGEKMDFCLI
jgi:hypothetical protein